MEFSIHGPFEVPRKEGYFQINNNKSFIEEFWLEVEKDQQGLSNAKGCYIFATQAAGGYTPWYIGLTSRQNFKGECFQSTKINYYNDGIYEKKGKPVIFLIAYRTNKKKFSNSIARKELDFLESLLIGEALKKNEKLLNKQKTRYLREMIVPRLINSPQRAPTIAEKEFALLL